MRGMWNELIDLARWAPSPHNIQPWRMRIVSKSEAHVLYDPARLLPETDPTGRFSVVGLGILLETLTISARGQDADIDVELITERLEAGPGPPRLWARLRLRAHPRPPHL